VKTLLLVASVSAACVTSANDYPVVAVAELQSPDSTITGRLELLGGIADDVTARTLAAYRVRLPDAAPRRVRLYYNVDNLGTHTCDSNPEELQLISDLQTIQRAGDETHFVIANVRVGDHVSDIDVETLPVNLSLDSKLDARSETYVIGKIVVVSGLDRDDERPGDRLACGSFVATEP